MDHAVRPTCRGTSVLVRNMRALVIASSLLVITSTAALAQALPGTLFAVRENGDVLERIDPTTLSVTTIGPLGTLFNFGGLAWDAESQTLYMIAGRGNNALYTVDTTTGAATLVGYHGITDLFGLEFVPGEGLYASQFSGGNGLYGLNAATGAPTLIGSTPQLGGLAYASNTDQLIGIQDGAGELCVVNRTNGSTTPLYNGGYTNDSGLAYDPDRNAFWDIDWDGNLYRYDVAAGYARTTVISGLGAHDGLAYIAGPSGPATVPEPGALALLAGAGTMTLAVCRRKRMA